MKSLSVSELSLTSGLPVAALTQVAGRLVAVGVDGDGEVGSFDRVVVATGQRSELGLTRELCPDLDPRLESTRALGPAINPNLHSCGSVPPHEHRGLAHPERDLFTVAVKSYGRAPIFLVLTGYEQIRSVVAAIAGDLEAAGDVRLTLPRRGVCSTSPASASACCGGRARSDAPGARGPGVTVAVSVTPEGRGRGEAA